MKTRDFVSDEEVAVLVDAFEDASIPPAGFTHAAHIVVALSYLEHYGADEALSRMREKVRSYATRHGKSNLYHETLTTFWMRLLDHLSANRYAEVPLWQRANAVVEEWPARRPVEAHYTRETITSSRAREQWVPPDRLPLPF